MDILLIIGIILLVLWLLGFILLPVLGWLIHIALIIAGYLPDYLAVAQGLQAVLNRQPQFAVIPPNG
ncbi:MAG: DUF5670 family protein [Dehalococcoidia bacterium]|jgi:Na+/H+ antiporter NhaC